MKNDLQIIILAAGKGTRMGGDLPKALAPLKEKSILSYVLETAEKFLSKKPLLVLGYQAHKILDFLGTNSEYPFVLQREMKGTGHAVLVAHDGLEKNISTVIVLYADQPFISKATLEKLRERREETGSKLVIATSTIKDENLFKNQFFNFGRIVRNHDGKIIKIVEKKDASEEELLIREVNPAYFCFDRKWAFEHLKHLKNDNVQGEYYLTDLVQQAFNDGFDIESIQIDEREALGANTKEQLKLLEKFF